MSIGLAEVRTEVRILSRATRGFIGVFGALILTGLVSGSFWAGSLSSRVGGLESKLGEINVRFDKLDARIDKLDARIDKLDARIDRIEGEMRNGFNRLEAAITKASPKP